MTKTRETLFSVHTHSDGHIALYLEEQDAVKDLIQDVVGSQSLADLDYLRGAADRSLKSDGYFENLDSARDNLAESAPLLCNMSEQEALILAEDIIRAVKFARIGREAFANYPTLKAVQ